MRVILFSNRVTRIYLYKKRSYELYKRVDFP